MLVYTLTHKLRSDEHGFTEGNLGHSFKTFFKNHKVADCQQNAVTALMRGWLRNLSWVQSRSGTEVGVPIVFFFYTFNAGCLVKEQPLSVLNVLDQTQSRGTTIHFIMRPRIMLAEFKYALLRILSGQHARIQKRDRGSWTPTWDLSRREVLGPHLRQIWLAFVCQLHKNSYIRELRALHRYFIIF